MVSCRANNQKGSSLKHEQKLEEALALIIACTRRVKRTKDIVTLAKNISYAEQRMEGLGAVAQAVRLSVQQLKDFLAVEKLCDEVKALVENRAIDSVDMVKTISNMAPDKQKVLANYLVEGKLTSEDVRIIVAFAKRFPQKSMTKVIKNYEKSKDVRVYVVEFRITSDFGGKVKLQRWFGEIVGRRQIRSLLVKDGVGVLKVSSTGLKNLRAAVRENKTTLRKFVASVVKGAAVRK